MNMIRKLAVAAILAGSVAVSSAQVGGTWTGSGTGSTNLNWSNPDNWYSGTVPASFDKVYLQDIFFSGWTNVPAAVNNIIDQNMQVGTLYYSAFSSPNAAGVTNWHYYTTQIPLGKTLRVTGLPGATTFAVGDIPGESGWINGAYSNYTTFTGEGTLFIDSLTNGLVSVGGANSSAGTFLDLYNLNTFSNRSDRFWVAVSRDNPYGSSPFANIWLARTNRITTRANGGSYPSVLIGSAATTSPGNIKFVFGGVNEFNTESFVFFGARGPSGSGVATFNNTSWGVISNGAARLATNTGTFKLRNTDGVSRASYFSIMDQTADPDFFGPPGKLLGSLGAFVDFRNGTVDILADKMYVSRASLDGGVNAQSTAFAPNGNPVLSWDTGTIDVNDAWIGYYDGVSNGIQGSASIVLTGNAVWNVQNNLTMSFHTNNGTTSGLILGQSSIRIDTNAVLNVGGNIVFNDGNWSASLTNAVSTNLLVGGRVNMVNHGIAQFYSIAGYGTITNASQIQVGGMNFSSANGVSLGTITPGLPAPQGGYNVGTLNLGNNVVFMTNSTLVFDLGATTNIGPTNDFINITGDLVCNSNVIVVNPYMGSLQVGQYRLINYTGNLIGDLELTNNTRSALSLDTNTPGQIKLVVSSWNPNYTLYWNGGVPIASGFTNVDYTNLYWTNIASALITNVYPFDNLVFDDAYNPAGDTNIFLRQAGGLVLSGITFNTTNKEYWTRSAAGILAGPMTFTKNGPGQLYWGGIGNQAGNAFFGNVNINKGVVRHFGGTALWGIGPNPITIADGSQVVNGMMFANGSISGGGWGVVNATNFPAPYRPVFMAGAGPDGYGCIFHPVNSVGALVSSAWTLTGNATAGGTNLGGANPPRLRFTGVYQVTGQPLDNLAKFDLNGFNFTNAAPPGLPLAAFYPGLVGYNFLAITNTSGANGDIVASLSWLAFNNCTVDGPGTIKVGTNGVYFGLQGDTAWGGQGYIKKAMSLSTNGSIVASASGLTGTTSPNVVPLNGPISIEGNINITNNQPVVISGPITETTVGASINKAGNSNLTINAAASYTGPTFIRGGTLTLGASGSLASSFLYVGPGGTFDVSALPGYTLGSGIGLNVDGLVNSNSVVTGNLTVASGANIYGIGIFNGNLTANAGSELAPGDTNNLGQFVVNGNLALKGAHLTWDVAPSFAGSDGIVVNGNLDISTTAGNTNVWTIDSIGGFGPGGTNTLITYTGSLTTNAAGALTGLGLFNPNVSFILQLIDPAATPGKIQVKVITYPNSLLWTGTAQGSPTNRFWDVKTTTNWLFGATVTNFGNADAVTFNQTGAAFDVILTNSLAGSAGKAISPGTMTVTNATYNFQGLPGIITASLLVSNSATVTISNRTANQFIGDGLIVDNLSTVGFRQATNVSVLTDLRGSGTINKEITTNDLQFVGDATFFTGTMNVSAGQVSAGLSNAIAGTVNVAAGATFNVNGQAVPNAQIIAQGNGWDGLGALNNRSTLLGTNFPPYNSSMQNQQSWVSNNLTSVSLSGDILLGAVGSAWSIQNLSGNGLNLAKTNVNDIWIGQNFNTGLGNIDIKQGRLVFARAGNDWGSANSGRITLWSGATLGLAATNAPIGNPLGVLFYLQPSAKPIVATNGTIQLIVNGSPQSPTGAITSPIFFTNNLTLYNETHGRSYYWGNISNTTPFAATGNGILSITNGGDGLYLLGTNGYISNTWIQAGTVIVSNVLNLPTNTWVVISNNLQGGFPLLDLQLGGAVLSNRTFALQGMQSFVTLQGEAEIRSPLFLFPSANFQGSQTPGAVNFTGTGTGLQFTGTNNTFVTANLSGTFSVNGTFVRFLNGLRLANPPLTTNLTPGIMIVSSNSTAEFDATNDWNSMKLIAGRVTVGAANALPAGAPIDVAGGASTIDLHGNSLVLSSIKENNPLGFTGNFNSQSLSRVCNDSPTTAATLTWSGTSGYKGAPFTTNCWTVELVDAITNAGTAKSLGFTMTSGLLETLATNTHSGPTLVSGGKFLLGRYTYNPGAIDLVGALPPTTSVTVTNTGIFGGNGYIGCPVTVWNGGTLLPGECLTFWSGTASVGPTVVTRTGQLMIDNKPLVFNPGSTAYFNADNVVHTNSSVVGMSSVTYGGTLIVSNISNEAFVNGQVIKLFDAGSYSGAFSSVLVWGALNGTAVNTNNLTVDGTISITNAVSTAPFSITKARPDKNHLTLSWPADHIGWRLQIMTNSLNTGMLTTNTIIAGGKTNAVQNASWVNCDNSQNIISTNLTIGATNVVFRMTYP